MEESTTPAAQPDSFPFVGLLSGRLRRMNLSLPNAFQPVYEAISNSLYAIGKAGLRRGRIDITIQRDKAQKDMLNESEVVYPIRSVHVQDDGVGFDDENFKAFQTPDTLQKVSVGGKGIGRLLWLKAFGHVEVQSVFRSNGDSPQRRAFHFVQDDTNAIQHYSCAEVGASAKNLTTIRLIGFLQPYRDKFHLRPEAIADRIIARFLLHFLQEDCPRIRLVDSGEPIDLNGRFGEDRVREIAKVPMDLKGHSLRASIMQLRPGGGRRNHSLHLCAADCEVETIDLQKHLSYLPQHIPDADNNPTRLAVYVTGDYLNTAANEQRTAFNFPKEENLLDPTLQEIIDGSCSCVSDRYELLMGREKERVADRVRRFITGKRQAYRPLLGSLEDHLPRLEKCKTDQALDVELNEIVREMEMESEAEFAKYKETTQGLGEEAFKICLMKISDISRVRLAQYVARRRAALYVLGRLLQARKDGKSNYEADIHDLVFPMGKTSDEVPVDRWNLWLIDERLGFHEFLASDKPLKSQEAIDSNSGDEPDLLVLNRPGAFVDGYKSQYESIVIVEFKRPMREDVGYGELPHEQALRYVKKICAGTEEDVRKRPINANRSRFYCYLICDFTPKLKERLFDDGWISTPDELGFFKPNLNQKEGRFIYYEYISFDKMYDDAEKRNQALFHKLGIVPDPVVDGEGGD